MIAGVTVAATLAAGALGAPAAAGAAMPAAVGAAQAAASSDVVCTVDDPRATELSGLVATAEGYVSIVDSQFDSEQVVIVYLDHACRVDRTLAYPTLPRDPEDLAVAPDGALWVADIGDNVTASTRRQTIALWRIPPGGGAPLIHRLTYPDGAHDAEALLFAAQGAPIVVTKDLLGTSGLYQATRPLEPGTAAGVPMRRVGQFSPFAMGADDDLGHIAELLVTGAAIAPDRQRVALRTYTTAYEWDVPDGDVVKAITSTTPRMTLLPDDVQGEALAYTVDGQYFLTVGDQAGPAAIRRYVPGENLPPGGGGGPGVPQPGASGPDDGRQTATLVATANPYSATPMGWYGLALAVAGTLVLVGAVVWFIARSRRRAF